VLRATGGQFEPRLPVFQAPHTLVLKNEEPDSLNFHWQSYMSIAFNRLVPAQQRVEAAIERPDVLPGSVRCSIFPWMKSCLFPCKHRYFAVSADDGTFRIENLPLGEWEFQVWHERTGRLQTDHWPRGRFTLKIEAGTNDLGLVKLHPDLFEEKDEGEKAEKQEAEKQDVPASDGPEEAKNPRTIAELRELRKAVNDLRIRANSLRNPKSLDVLANPDFELPRQDDLLPGWTFANGNGISVDLDPTRTIRLLATRTVAVGTQCASVAAVPLLRCAAIRSLLPKPADYPFGCGCESTIPPTSHDCDSVSKDV